jgi:hypothetical protein
MKRTLLILLATAFATALVAGTAFAQEIKLSGEVKTGIFWRDTFNNGDDDHETKTLIHSMDDAGSEDKSGRIRMNLDYDNGNGFGIRLRYNTETLDSDTGAFPVVYAFGYGNFFDNQMTVAIGKLGASPWDTGGPEMWKQLENNNFGGMRVEWKPNFLPVGKLNLGFVLNWFDSPAEAAGTAVDSQTLINILGESVIGVSYTHDLFMVRTAYRLDSAYDQRDRGIQAGEIEGGELVYRVEEYLIRNYLPGFSVWALGHLLGVGSNRSDLQLFRNWLFAQYAPDLFTAQLRFGYEFMESRSRFFAKPSFYLNLFEKLLSVGVSFQYAQDFGDGKIYEGSPFESLELEPKVQLNFLSSYIAFVYNWKREYTMVTPAQAKYGLDPIRQTHRINLRFCIYY